MLIEHVELKCLRVASLQQLLLDEEIPRKAKTVHDLDKDILLETDPTPDVRVIQLDELLVVFEVKSCLGSNQQLFLLVLAQLTAGYLCNENMKINFQQMQRENCLSIVVSEPKQVLIEFLIVYQIVLEEVKPASVEDIVLVESQGYEVVNHFHHILVHHQKLSYAPAHLI